MRDLEKNTKTALSSSELREAQKNTDINRLMVMGLTLIYFLTLITLGLNQVFFLSIWHKVLINGIILLCAVINIFAFIWFHKTEGLKTWYVASYLIIYTIIIITTRNLLIQFSIFAPLLACTLYYNKTFVRNICIWVIGLNALIFIGAIITGFSSDLNTEFYHLVLVLLFSMAVYYTTRIGHRYHFAAIEDITAQQERTTQLLKDVLNIASSVKGKTSQSNEIIERLAVASEQVNSAIDEIAIATQHTATTIGDQTVMTATIQDAINSTLHNAQLMTQVAQASEETLHENAIKIQKIQEHSSDISEINKNVAASMNELHETTRQMKDITSIILNITTQTNLLALNASIESARAGEAGKGFAVVADEIRKLAEQSKVATENIGQLIDALNDNALNATATVTASIEKTQLQEALITEAASSFNSLNQNMASLKENISGIDTRIQDLAVSNNQIVDSINQLSGTSEEVTATAQETINLSSSNKKEALNTKALLEAITLEVANFDKYINQ